MEIRIMLFILMMMVMPVSYAACYSELSVQHNGNGANLLI